ncbi:MAG: hypothetical protein AAFV80_00790, partial [Bacteroidota bacterium]
SVIEYKILVHRKRAMKDWYNRIINLYQLSGTEKGFEAIPIADEMYRQINLAQLQNWKAAYGITHFITFADHDLNAELLFENEAYRLYRIP